MNSDSNEPAADGIVAVADERRRRAIRALAVQDLDRRGLSVQSAAHDASGDDRLVDDAGHQYWLHNLQLQCAKLPESEWAGAVEFHFRQQFAAREAPRVGDLAYVEFLAQVRTRLQQPDTSGMLSMNYARPAFDGLVAELSRDLPTAVRTVSDSDVAGRDLDFLYEVGQRNTDAEPTTIDRLDHEVFALTGDSFFIASKALNMPHLIDTVLGGRAPLGVLFGVPYRSVLLLHAVGSAAPGEAVSLLASATLRQAYDAPGGTVSHNTYFWQRGTAQCITRINPDTQILEILVDGAFGEVYTAAVRQRVDGQWDAQNEMEDEG
ncbi:hypothetical protein [Mycobacteroides franklinii]|uniref:Uncharacterized protein n=1 Tax=Mycobacteroides franklinii TaxID=948102 RepID=A0A4R5PFW5_9MYCO|nr:hypothetical protein [Mycobacteroides franklinii]ORA59211.1 hypothetical protein BST24_17800 [Mycobacteroides franklinii]TDH24315.1 hypothetical protein EJ571_04090 [Mycobacteroides franklinii]